MAERRYIDEIHISNFKFFPEIGEENKPIKIDGKHLLLYGENGSGKSSIFWALYTLLECANKATKSEIMKYFDYEDKHNLLNINSIPLPVPDNKEVKSAFVKLLLKDDADKTYYHISFNDTIINENDEAKKSNYASDFINYKFLQSAYNIKHKDPINLYESFKYNIFPYIKFEPCKIWRVNHESFEWEDVESENANEVMDFVVNGPIYSVISGDKRNYDVRAFKKREIADRILKAISELKKWTTHINTRGNEILKNEFGYGNIEFKLQIKYSKEYHITKRKYTPPEIELLLSIPNYEGNENKVPQPQSFLNEAKLTAVSLAIRFAVLEKRISDAEIRILVLDDLMISLDMSNREKVLNLIFDKYLDKYQIFILTHDKVFFEFIKLYIKQKSSLQKWQISELYAGTSKTGTAYPVLINGESGYFEKAEKYFYAKDYTTCSLYIRKELERLIIERLPSERLLSIDGKFKDLSFMWGRFVERYEKLNHPISATVKFALVQTKLMLLNPQAHYNLSYPVYSLELENAFKLISHIEANYPIPASTILLSKGMQMRFKHPDQDYTFDFELLSDFTLDGLNGATSLNLPRCRVLHWQYNETPFWNFKTSMEHTLSEINTIRERTVKIDRVRDNLKKIPILAITDIMFNYNTVLFNGFWTLSELLTKANVTF